MGRMAGGFIAAVFLSWLTVVSGAFNITKMLNGHPNYSRFNEFLTSSGVAGEINSRTSLTVLAPTNGVLTAFFSGNVGADSGEVADICRYHVMLQYLSMKELRAIVPGTPIQVTTLLQTTGRIDGNEGTVNINHDGKTIGIGLPIEGAPANGTILADITNMPYNISVLEVDSVLVPPGWGTRESESANITAALEAAKNYQTFIRLIKDNGIDIEYAAKQTGSGITVFAPTDASFAALPSGALAALTPNQVKQVLRAHALGVYYPLGTLSTLSKPDEPTLATITGGPGSYLVNVSSGTTGVVQLSTGVSTAVVGDTLYDTTPTAVFAINTVLLPQEIFAVAPTPAVAPAPLSPALAPAPLSPVPAPAPGTPVPAPAPVPTPSSAPAPAPEGPAPVPSPDIAPGPPAPPEESPIAEAPEPSAEAPSTASVIVLSRVTMSTVVFFSGLIMLL